MYGDYQAVDGEMLQTEKINASAKNVKIPPAQTWKLSARVGLEMAKSIASPGPAPSTEPIWRNDALLHGPSQSKEQSIVNCAAYIGTIARKLLRVSIDGHN